MTLAGVKLCAAAALASMLTAPAHATQTPAVAGPKEYYVLAPVRADFKATRRLGARRAGLVCLPAGSFTWHDARAGMDNATAAVTTALQEVAPVRIDTVDDGFAEPAAAPRFRIVATLTDVSLNACQRTWGLAVSLTHRHALSGRGHLRVTWEILDRTTRSNIAQETVDTYYELAPDTEDAADALVQGLKRNAVQFAERHWPDAAAQR